MDRKTAIQLIGRRFKETSALLVLLSRDALKVDVIVKIAFEIAERFKRGGGVLVFGNGGSAADAQHFAAELVGGYAKRRRRPLNVLALTTNTSNLTAIANDYGYAEVFVRQLEAYGRKGDVAVGISTSGNSKNVIEALRKAKEIGMFTVGFTGASSGKMKACADIIFQAPTTVTARIQEVHIAALHAVCDLVETTLFGRSS